MMLLGLVHEECIAKMRLMSLVDLSSDASGTIPYELIRDTLQVNLYLVSMCCNCVLRIINEILQCLFQINDDEVELWVVRAITAKLIDCKLDQMKQVVVVRYVLLPSIVFLWTLLSFYTIIWTHGCAPLGHDYFVEHHISPHVENSFCCYAQFNASVKFAVIQLIVCSVSTNGKHWEQS